MGDNRKISSLFGFNTCTLKKKQNNLHSEVATFHYKETAQEKQNRLY